MNEVIAKYSDVFHQLKWRRTKIFNFSKTIIKGKRVINYENN